METKLFNSIGNFICECRQCKCQKCNTIKLEDGRQAVQIYRTTKRIGINHYKLVDVYICLKCRARWEDMFAEKEYEVPKIQENYKPKKKSRLLKDYDNQEINVAEIPFA